MDRIAPNGTGLRRKSTAPLDSSYRRRGPRPAKDAGPIGIPRYLAGRPLWRPAAQVRNGFDEYPVKAFNIFVDFYPLDADCFRVGEELVCEFSDKHCIGRRCLGDLISDPFVQKTDAACAHPKIHQAPRLQTASTRTVAEIIIPLRFCHFGGGLGTSFSEWLSIRDKLW